MPGTASVPNVLSAQAGPTFPASLEDDNWTALTTYINDREITAGVLSARPAFGVAGRTYLATDVGGGTLYLDTGAAWLQVGGPVSGTLPRNYGAGCTLSNNVADATNDLDIAIGAWRDSTNTENLVLAAALTKRLDAAWAVGTNQGGLDTGAAADTTYYTYLIKRVDTNVVDVLFSVQPAVLGPTVLPTNYTKWRYIGAFRRVGGVIRSFTQYGDEFWLNTVQAADLAGNPAATTLLSLTLPEIPNNLGIAPEFPLAILRVASDGNNLVHFHDPNGADVVASVTVAPLGTVGSTATPFQVNEIRVRCNNSSAVAYRALSTTVAIRVVTLGWVDRRQKDQ